MKIAATAQQPQLDSPIDPRFGRAAYFIVVDSETMDCQAIENVLDASSGVGISSGKKITDTGAKVLLTGNCGPNAYRTLQAGGIEVYTGFTGTVRQAVEDYKSGKLTPANNANVQSHTGTGPQS